MDRNNLTMRMTYYPMAWLVAQSGGGKTTLVERLREKYNRSDVFALDNDILGYRNKESDLEWYFPSSLVELGIDLARNSKVLFAGISHNIDIMLYHWRAARGAIIALPLIEVSDLLERQQKREQLNPLHPAKDLKTLSEHTDWYRNWIKEINPDLILSDHNLDTNIEEIYSFLKSL